MGCNNLNYEDQFQLDPLDQLKALILKSRNYFLFRGLDEEIAEIQTALLPRIV